MKKIGQPERVTQNRVTALFRNELGYRYLGDWTERGCGREANNHMYCTVLTYSNEH